MLKVGKAQLMKMCIEGRASFPTICTFASLCAYSLEYSILFY